MSHHLIHDPSQIHKFAELVFDQSGATLLTLMARDKYLDIPSFGNHQLEQRTIDVDKQTPDQLVRYIRRFEVPFDSFEVDGKAVPTGCLAVYMAINPRDTKLALHDMASQFYKGIVEGNGPTSIIRVEGSFRSALTKRYVKKRFIDLDVDTKNPSHLEAIAVLSVPMAEAFVACIETANGFHYLLNRDKMRSEWHKMLHEFHLKTAITEKNRLGENVTKYWFSIASDANVPVPGTRQGSWNVRFA